MQQFTVLTRALRQTAYPTRLNGVPVRLGVRPSSSHAHPRHDPFASSLPGWSHHHNTAHPPRVTHPPPNSPSRAGAVVNSTEKYHAMHAASLSSPTAFWGPIAASLKWFKPFTSVLESDTAIPRHSWFGGGSTNMAMNCLDVHVDAGRGDTPALTWEGDDGTSKTYTYRQLRDAVAAAAAVLVEGGVTRGSVVTIMLPMIPALPITMLACARLGALHSVVFAGFSAAALADRIVDAGSTHCVTANGGLRGGRVVPLKGVMDEAVEIAGGKGVQVQRVFVASRAGQPVGPLNAGWVVGRDVDYDAAVSGVCARAAPAAPEFPPVEMGSEDPLFILYTSGSTGKPKGVVHATGGYMVCGVHGRGRGEVWVCVSPP